MVEKQVDEELISLDLQAELAADKGETGPHFQETPGDVAEQRAFNVVLMCLVAESKEVEMVGVFKDRSGKAGLWRREALIKISDGRSLPEVELVFDLNGKSRPGPNLLDGLAGIPFPNLRIRDLGQQGDDMEPGQLVSRLLTNFAFRAFLGEKSHVFEIRSG